MHATLILYWLSDRCVKCCVRSQMCTKYHYGLHAFVCNGDIVREKPAEPAGSPHRNRTNMQELQTEPGSGI